MMINILVPESRKECGETSCMSCSLFEKTWCFDILEDIIQYYKDRY